MSQLTEKPGLQLREWFHVIPTCHSYAGSDLQLVVLKTVCRTAITIISDKGRNFTVKKT